MQTRRRFAKTRQKNGMGRAVADVMRRHVPADTGSVVGDYVLGKRIGAGGMGVVYEAAHGHTCVAIKIPYCEMLGDDYASRRFRDEGIAGSIVEHPNLGRVLARGETANGIPYLVMEHVRGQHLSSKRRMSMRQAATLVRQVLNGLDALHSTGIVHADVKTNNILVESKSDGSHVARLVDFGLAHVDGEDAHGPDRISGTPEYMAPEVIRGEGSTPASDIYAAGVILYELICGATPFGSGSSSEILHRHLTENVIPPSLRCERDVPPILERIVMRALEKDPRKRFVTAAAFAAALGVAIPVLDNTATARPSVSLTARTLEWRPRVRTPRASPSLYADSNDPAHSIAAARQASRALSRRARTRRRRARAA
jgi:eukaryotic-like serine/threonine-protein kinase